MKNLWEGEEYFYLSVKNVLILNQTPSGCFIWHESFNGCLLVFSLKSS